MSRPRRLCMVVHGPYPVGEPRVVREAAAAVAAGFEVDVVAMRSPGEATFEEVHSVRVHRLQDLRSSRSRPIELGREYLGFSLLAAGRVARLHRERRFGVVQIHNPPDFLMAAAVVPRLRGARVVFDIHDLSPELFLSRLARRRGASTIARVLRWVESAAVSMSDAAIPDHRSPGTSRTGCGCPCDRPSAARSHQMTRCSSRLAGYPAAATRQPGRQTPRCTGSFSQLIIVCGGIFPAT